MARTLSAKEKHSIIDLLLRDKDVDNLYFAHQHEIGYDFPYELKKGTT